MTLKIKFSHLYEKIDWKPKTARLLQVVKSHYNDLSVSFIEYDTTYHSESGQLKYPLPKTDLIILIFFDEDREIIWTTIRRYTEQKFKYYKSCENKLFDVVIEDE